MPNRYVRASAIESETVNTLSWQGEVFYRRLLNRADDFGLYTANINLLRASLFPLQMDRVSVKDTERLLAECAAVGLLFLYESQGKPLLVMNKWEKGRAKRSEYDSPPPEILQRMKTYVYINKHMFTYVPDSDSDSDSVPDTDSNSDTNAGMGVFTSLRQSLGTAYKRQDTDLWSYEEESGLSAISRRPNAKAECEELLKFKLDPDSFFPQSLQSLLSRWGETLDRARNTTAKPLSVTEKGILSKEYDRVLDKLKSLTSQYSGHQDWTVADKLERTKLRDRRDELKAKLGIEV